MQLSDTPPAFIPLGGQLYRRIEMRRSILKVSLAEMQASYAQRGLLLSGALVRGTIRAFEDEAKIRVEIIEAETRKYRASCSPIQIIEGKKGLNDLLQRVTAQALFYVRLECEEIISVFSKKDEKIHKSMLDIMIKEINEITRIHTDLIYAVVEEIAMAAETDKQATTNPNRPSYVYQTTIHGAVGSLVQGDAKIGNIHQSNQGPLDLNQVTDLLKAALAEWPADLRKAAAGSEAAIAEEAKLEQPDIGLVRSAAAKLGKLSEAILPNISTQVLLGYLKAHGLVP